MRNMRLKTFILKNTLTPEEATSRGIQWRGGYSEGWLRGYVACMATLAFVSALVSALVLLVRG